MSYFDTCCDHAERTEVTSPEMWTTVDLRFHKRSFLWLLHFEAGIDMVKHIKLNSMITVNEKRIGTFSVFKISSEVAYGGVFFVAVPLAGSQC